jgi:hypothetical protein
MLRLYTLARDGISITHANDSWLTLFMASLQGLVAARDKAGGMCLEVQ